MQSKPAFEPIYKEPLRRFFEWTANEPEELYAEWRLILENFSSLKLTKATDRFPALSGMAHMFQPLVGDSYLAGFWKRDILRFLPWHEMHDSYCWETKLPPADIYALSTAKYYETELAPKPYIAPSWSFASVNWGVAFHDIETSSSSEFSDRASRVLDVKVVPATSDPMGQVASGFIQLSSILKPITIMDGSGRSSIGKLHMVDPNSGDVVGYCFLDILFRKQPDQQVFSMFYHPINNATLGNDDERAQLGLGLLLVSTGRNHQEYQRVGISPRVRMNFFEGCERTSITLI
ncbi:hypothetical protein DL95DRAFT_306399 [Leptodontidium sp. 2 PMI_412]|nr:hypothetical protein DL95DRAFT_306399 [Leptodontidium sp. 2 PMI_412]